MVALMVWEVRSNSAIVSPLPSKSLVIRHTQYGVLKKKKIFFQVKSTRPWRKCSKNIRLAVLCNELLDEKILFLFLNKLYLPSGGYIDRTVQVAHSCMPGWSFFITPFQHSSLIFIWNWPAISLGNFQAVEVSVLRLLAIEILIYCRLMPNYRKAQLFQMHTTYFMKKNWTFEDFNLKKVIARWVLLGFVW